MNHINVTGSIWYFMYNDNLNCKLFIRIPKQERQHPQNTELQDTNPLDTEPPRHQHPVNQLHDANSRSPTECSGNKPSGYQHPGHLPNPKDTNPQGTYRIPINPTSRKQMRFIGFCNEEFTGHRTHMTPTTRKFTEPPEHRFQIAKPLRQHTQNTNLQETNPSSVMYTDVHNTLWILCT